jgi:hypothetical protein
MKYTSDVRQTQPGIGDPLKIGGIAGKKHATTYRATESQIQ